MRTFTDYAGLIVLLAFAIILPILTGAALESHGYSPDLARPAILA